MAAADKGDLARAGTIEVTSKEGKAFLEKNLTEWKKPGLLGHFAADDNVGSSENALKKGGGAKKKGPTKKTALAKKGTMVATAKEGNDLLAGEKLGDTRLMTKKKPVAKATNKRANTMARVVKEAEELVGNINASEGRKLRKRAAPPSSPVKKSPLKKARTMVNTAKEGKAFLKGSKAKK